MTSPGVTRKLTPAEAVPFAYAAFKDAEAAGDKATADRAQAFIRRLWRNLDDGAELLPGEPRLKRRDLELGIVSLYSKSEAA